MSCENVFPVQIIVACFKSYDMQMVFAFVKILLSDIVHLYTLFNW